MRRNTNARRKPCYPRLLQKGHDLIKKGEPLFLEILKMRVIHRFNVYLTTMDFTIYVVMRVAEFREMGVRLFKSVNAFCMLRKLICDIMRCMRHVGFPQGLNFGDSPTVRKTSH